MNNWTVLSTFTYPHEAHIIGGRLESEGIDVQIKDELTAQIYNFYSNAIGGVKLLVRDSDYQKAHQICSSTETTKVNQSHNIKEPNTSFTCPYCNSTNVAEKKQPGYVAVFSMIFLNFPLPFFKKNHYCFDCENEWELKN